MAKNVKSAITKTVQSELSILKLALISANRMQSYTCFDWLKKLQDQLGIAIAKVQLYLEDPTIKAEHHNANNDKTTETK